MRDIEHDPAFKESKQYQIEKFQCNTRVTSRQIQSDGVHCAEQGTLIYEKIRCKYDRKDGIHPE